MTVWAIVVAAGRGIRFGGPKAQVELAGRRVVDWSVAAARTVADGVVLVVPPGEVERWTPTGAEPVAATPPIEVVVAGGETRSESVRAGLAALAGDVTVVVVHDAARPAASSDLFRAVVAAVVGGADGAVPGLPLVDTVKRVSADRRVVETFERSELVAVQTPQAFAAAWLTRAHAPGRDATDDAALVELAGGSVVVVPGEAGNRKLTTPDDLPALVAAIRAGAGSTVR